MIRINQIKLPVNHKDSDLAAKISRILNLPIQAFEFSIIKKSIDSRKKPDIFYVYTVSVVMDNEEKLLKKLHNKNISIYKKVKYQAPACGCDKLVERPVIVGAGPAGLFCALLLVQNGYKPILIERGKAVEERIEDVNKFWETGVLDPSSNAVFGEGGAGTFSDGKLNTGVKDPIGRIDFVLETFVKFGAKESIIYDNKPHIGTDELIKILKRIREYLLEHGCDIRFKEQFINFSVASNELSLNELSSIVVKRLEDNSCYEIKTNALVLAPGHGARDTFEMLYQHNISMNAKPFAVGFRVEHPQEMINEFAYGTGNDKNLPASPYKVTSNFPNGRGVYSFCMCPGGYVVNSSSEEGHLVVNGMSYSKRDSANANSAIIISVNENDIDLNDPLSGLKFQEQLEKKTYELANGRIPQQLFGDYKNNRASLSYGNYSSMVKGATAFSNLRGLLSSDMEEAFIAGMEHFGKIIPGFDRDDAIISGTETRTSSPVRLNRNEEFLANIKGVYPCGEGAGYAGGITSAAMDGLKVAEAIIKKFHPDK